MKKLKLISPLILLIFITACATLQGKDTAKIALYTAKEAWTEIRTYVITQNLTGEITDEELEEFKTMDATFTQYYEAALMLYLAGKEDTEDFEHAMDVIRNVLLEARQKYYNK